MRQSTRKRIVVTLLAPFLFLTPSCDRTIVVNNAFVYLVAEECYEYGSINGEQWQPVYVGEFSSIVTAVPKEGFVFAGWSDGLLTASRTDLAKPENGNGPVVFYALFEVNNG